MSLRSYIPVNKDNLPEVFEFELGGTLYNIGVNYNKSGGYFTVDLYDDLEQPIVLGERLIPGRRLWADIVHPLIPSDDVVPMDESNPQQPITWDNFGDTVQLYFDDLEESVDG